MTGGYWGDVIEGTPRALRRATIEKDFIPYVKGIFAKRADLRSAMLLVAQYWADEADDAVHATVLFSPRETPLWPHRCRWEVEDDGGVSSIEAAEACSACGEDLGWMNFNDNGEETIAAFQSCCREDASQESPTDEAYLPYAVGRRATHTPSEVDVEIVGGPVRGWLEDEANRSPPKPRKDDTTTTELFDAIYSSRSDDASRQVLADHLQQKGDPLGEYITLSFALTALQKDEDKESAARRKELRDRAARLEGRHGRSWLGPLAKVAPAEHVVFDRGFVRAIAVHFESDAVADETVRAREWGTVQRLRFLPHCVQRLGPTMTSLRFVGPLDASGLRQLAKLIGTSSLPVERAHVVVEDDAMLRNLADVELEGLRCLIVTATPGGIGASSRRTVRGRNPFTGQMMDYPDEATGSSRADLSPTVLAPLLRAPWWKQLDEIVVTSIDPEVISAWLRYPTEQRPKTVSFTAISTSNVTAGFRVRVIADQVARVDMPSLNADVGINALCDMLKALPSHVRVEMIPTRSFAPSDSDLEVLTQLAGRTTPITRRLSPSSSDPS